MRSTLSTSWYTLPIERSVQMPESFRDVLG